MTKPVVIYTCCGGAGGWSIFRSLQAVGKYRLIGVDSDPLAAGLYVDGLDGFQQIPAGDEPGYLEAIRKIARKEKADVIWPCSDEEVISLAPERDAFAAENVALVTANKEVVLSTSDKLETVQKLEPLGIPVPRSCSLGASLDQFFFPVIVRPKGGRSGHGVHFFDTPGQVDKFSQAMGADRDGYFVQEKIKAPVGHLHMAQAIFTHEQEMKTFFSSRSIRTVYEWGGPALGGVPVKNERLKELALRAFEATGPWYGPVNAEFLYDPAREDFFFIEINPRYWGYSYLATAAGLNFPDMTIRLALGEEITPELDYKTDVVTMTSREQISFSRNVLLGDLPAQEIHGE